MGKKKEKVNGGPNRAQRRRDTAMEGNNDQWSKKRRQEVELARQRHEHRMAMERRQQKTHERAVMRRKMAKVGEGIGQAHLERRAPKATKPKEIKK